MTIDGIKAEFDKFIEYPTDDKSYITTVSALLFAEHIASLVAEKERADPEWWSLVMCAAAELEEASIGMTDKDAKLKAEGAAKYYRARANELFAEAPEAV